MKKPITDWNKFRDQFVRETLRKASFRWPPRTTAIRNARVDRRSNPATGKDCWHVKCALCYNVVMEREARLDHIYPVVPLPGVQEEGTASSKLNVGDYVLRMFPEAAGFQVLCHSCHSAKTKEETGLRAEARRKAKGVAK